MGHESTSFVRLTTTSLSLFHQRGAGQAFFDTISLCRRPVELVASFGYDCIGSGHYLQRPGYILPQRPTARGGVIYIPCKEARAHHGPL